MQQYFRIVGSARYLPSRCITADELDHRLNLEPGWTARRTGVLRRYQAAEAENGATMARDVITRALESASRSLSGIDLLVDASLTVQQPIPCNAALIQEALGPEAAGIPAIDVHASCLSFLAALQMVNGTFAAKSAMRAIVVCAETPLRGVNWNEPESACLMGDGAVAVILEAAEPTNLFALRIQTFADGARLCECPGGGHRLPPYEYTADQQHRYQFHMDGKAVHKMASRKLPPMVESVLRDAGCTLDELDVIPHQASGPAIEFIARRLGIPRNKLHATISDHGNLVAAGMPYVLHEVRQQRPKGSRVMLLGTGAGYSQGAAVFTL